jgi:hypothetical protein
VPVAPFGFIPLLSMIIITVTLAYYAYQRMEYLIIVGLVLNFIFTGFNIGLYATYGILLFGWSQPLMAIITDRISIFGRILMAIGPMLILVKIQFSKHALWKKIRKFKSPSAPHTSTTKHHYELHCSLVIIQFLLFKKKQTPNSNNVVMH